MSPRSDRQTMEALFAGYLAYISVTIGLHLVGPWRYRDEEAWIVVGFMSAFLAIIFAGYVIGMRRRPRCAASADPRRPTIDRWVVGALAIALAIKAAVFADNVASTPSVSVLSSLANLGSVYSDALARARENTDVRTLVQVETLFGVVTQLALVGGMYRFDTIGRAGRWLLRILIGLMLVNAVMFRGTQIVLGALVIYWLSTRFVRRARLGEPLLERRVVAGTLVVLAAFAFTQASRLDSYGIATAASYPTHPLMSLDLDHWWFWVFGERLGFVLAVLVGYCSMGYYGLTLSLGLDFEWTRGLGSSFALASYGEQYLGVANQLERTYPLRVEAETGWPALMYWQTAFPWLASDLTWLGALMFLGALAYVYAVAWREAVRCGNVLSMLAVANLNVVWLFIPANNQVMQTRESAIAVIVIFGAWVMLHDRFNEAPDARPR